MFGRVRYWMAVLALLPLWAQAEDQAVTVTVRSLTTQVANDMALAALADCDKKGYKTAVAVVGRDGHMLAFVRDPLAGPHTVDVSYEKAYAAASFQSPTLEMREMEPLNFAPRVMLVGGGVPIDIGGNFYGAIGVSGAPPRKVLGDIDDECARAGIDALREVIEFAQ